MALDRPTYKMSKSHPKLKSRILLTDTREVITKKMLAALTDEIEGVSYDPVARPGVSNLIEIAYNLEGHKSATSPAEYAAEFDGLSLKALKLRVAEITGTHIEPIRERFDSIMKGNGKELNDAAAIGAQKANISASVTMERVRNAVGF